jgi:hypothetical protein
VIRDLQVWLVLLVYPGLKAIEVRKAAKEMLVHQVRLVFLGLRETLDWIQVRALLVHRD